MLEALHHRGPDDEGIYTNPELSMGIRRLSIIDVLGGNQPIFNEDRTLVVVCNGEIYNYRELTSELQSRGHVFRTGSDTEVIVHLYEELGEKCVHEFRGMFAFAVWDVRKQKLFLARDRLGIKPLYFLDDGRQLIFASEIKAILQHPDVTPSLDLEALSYYLSFKYVPAPLTLFSQIRSVPPGHQLCGGRRGLSLAPYWDVRFQRAHEPSMTESDCVENLKNLLREAVGLHLRSDVPVGAFLSGGLDSSLIVALMSEVTGESVKTFSVGFETDGPEGDELSYARIVADRYRTDHREILIKPTDFVDLAKKAIWHLDQPIADQATVATYLLSELASAEVKVVMSGEGGDELFAGYARYPGNRLAPWFHLLPKATRRALLAMAGQLPGMRRAKLALHALCQPDEASRIANWFPLFNSETKRAVLAAGSPVGDVLTSAGGLVAECLSRSDAVDSLNRMLYFDTKYWLPDLLLLRSDKLSMAVSVETRVPLLDHRIVEFAARLSPQLKLKGRSRKHILRQLCSGLLPDDIVHRRKQGFPIPIARWFRGELRSFVRDLLSPETIRARRLFAPRYVSRLIQEHESGFADHSSQLWGLMSVELWHRVFLDSSRPSPARK